MVDNDEESAPDEDVPLEDPLAWFQTWFDRAAQTDLELPHAVTLATVSSEGRPRARTVLLKDWDREGFVFYTNYSSAKAGDLGATARGTVVAYWEPIDRQVRITGPVERVAESTSDAYFASRPRESQIAAWASNQSAPIDSREELLECFEAYREQFAGDPVPRPDDWGGYRLSPMRIEFWRSRPHRLHDRWEFERSDRDDDWERTRLQP